MTLELTNGSGKTLFTTPCVIMKYILTKFQGIWIMNRQKHIFKIPLHPNFFFLIFTFQKLKQFSTCHWMFDMLQNENVWPFLSQRKANANPDVLNRVPVPVTSEFRR